MLNNAITLMKRSKVATKRMSSLVLSVFVLQVIAAGFCVSMVSTAPISQVKEMGHCMGSPMKLNLKSDMNMADNSSKKHACAHCDLPDTNLILDKLSIGDSDVSAHLFELAVVPMAFDVEVSLFLTTLPDLVPLKTSLTSFNLNLRTRV